MRIKRLVLVLFIATALIGCESDYLEPDGKDLKINNQNPSDKFKYEVVDFCLKQIENVDAKELLAFFGTKSDGDLIALKQVNIQETKGPDNVLMLIEKSNKKNPEDANKAAYVQDFGESAELNYLLENKETGHKGEQGKIEISKKPNESAIFIINYDLSEDSAELIIPKWDFEECVDRCISKELAKIFDEEEGGSRFKAATFVLSAGKAFYKIIIDCNGQCLNLW